MLVSFSYFLFRKRRIESEYGPILDSNNPHSLNKDSIDQGTLLFGMRSDSVSFWKITKYNIQ